MFTGSYDAEVGDVYWLTVDGSPPLLDPHCRDVVETPEGPRSVVRDPWPVRPRGRPLAIAPGVGPVVYEAHVRGFARTFAGMIDRLDYLADLGIDVIELMPVHPFDPGDNYWGYMPLVWGAVHRPFASNADDAPGELAALVAAAHERSMHVWLDVVFNHTGEGDATLPTRSLRGIDDAHAYRHMPDGAYVDDSGCGNDIDPADGEVRRLVLEALDRFADLGIDGFRFDLASLLTRDGGGLVDQITGWAFGRGVDLIAEPWDLAEYQLGAAFPGASWRQWNDRFRDDVRGFLRAEPGLVPAIVQRIGGSCDVFGDDLHSVNFVTAHDGLTMHDLTIVTSDHHHSWACGDALRLQQLKNYFTVLLLSAGTAMFVMGDEFARTQDGDPNPYDVDGPRSWVDWSRLVEWAALHDFVRALLHLRRECPPVGHHCYGVDGPVDLSAGSRSLAFATDQLYVMVNAWWEPLRFVVQEPGDWQVALETAPATPDGAVAPRSIRILRKSR
jgi:isoamylase